jgi:AmmeMemoRadiSam system protein A
MTEPSNSEANIDHLSVQEKNTLLRLAREALVLGVRGDPLPDLDIRSFTPKLVQPGATFVTLTKNQELRGCIGSLEAKRSLAEDVRIHAVAAALEDYRFPPVLENEVSMISIEISRLTTPTKVAFQNPDELISKIRPGIDGVIIKQGVRRATFLPQVWEKVPEIDNFLGMLCRKMGVSSNCWQSEGVDIFTYQVEKFTE